jgi:hypothetical protein
MNMSRVGRKSAGRRPNRRCASSPLQRAVLETVESRILFIQDAGLLVNIDATTLAPGPVTSITNTGTLGGSFAAPANADEAPVIGRPVATSPTGTQGIRLDGNDYLQLVDALGAMLPAPAGITGPDATTSVEAWVWNPLRANEETILAWGKRGGPDGTNASFNYGVNGAWGAIGRWGAPDIGWGPTVPAAGQWHHVAYTFDGTTTRVYVDGALANTEVNGAGAINTAPDTPINIGAQTEPDGVTPTGGLRGSMTIGRARIHDGVLTDAQILANYNEERAAFVEPVVQGEAVVKLVDVDPTTLTEGEASSLVNTGTMGGFFRATGGGDTTPVIDQPLAASPTGTRGIRMDGTDYLQHTDADGNLIPAPAGIVGNNPTSSVEVWAWNPGIPGEETMVAWGKRGGPDGTNYSFNYGNDNRWGAMGHWGGADMGWAPGTVDNAPAGRQWHHLVYTFDGETQRVYVDGVLANSELLGEGALNIYPDIPINFGTQIEPDGFTPTAALRGSLTLGRVRVYDGVLTDAQVAANHTAERANYVEPRAVNEPRPATKLVDVDATNLPDGAAANNIPNTGSLGGVFEATGGGTTVPVIDQPLTGSTAGTRGIHLDGTDYLQLVAAPGGATINAPASITNVNPQRSIETWVYNPGLAGEETMVSWGRRGGPDGSNLSFNYGSHNTWGALGQWGSPDMGWSPDGTDPAAGTWHHLAYTFDGVTQKVYVDGVMTNSEVLGEGTISTHPDTPINIGTQLEASGVPTQVLNGTLTLGKVRIYDGVLTDAQITGNFNTERAQFVNPSGIAPANLTSGPVHRYTFNTPAGAAADGTVINDEVGNNDLTVRGAGATFNGTELVLPGGASASAAYVDVPDGTLSKFSATNPDGTPNPAGTGQVTFEGWIRHTGNQGWSRIYDFGTGSAGALEGPGGEAAGIDFFMLTAQTGGDPIRRVEATDGSDGDATGNHWEEVTGTFDQDIHFAVTWNETTGELKYYQNGVEVTEFDSPLLISAIDDINNWLGRSQFTGDANLQGEFDEFRIYDHALTPGEVLGNFRAGPNVVTGGDLAAVTAAYVSGSAWTTDFKAELVEEGLGHATHGFRIDAAAADLSLPWSNINRVTLVFDRDVTVEQGDLTVAGRTIPSYAITGFTYEPATRTATWSLGSPIADYPARRQTADRVTVRLATDVADFDDEVVVVPGDANQNGNTSPTDFGSVRAAQGRNTVDEGTAPRNYTVFRDVNANGNVSPTDIGVVRGNTGAAAPAPPPAIAGRRESISADFFSDTEVLA